MSKTLEELGYEKREIFNIRKENVGISFCSTDKQHAIDFNYKNKTIKKYLEEINMEELKAIYKYCEDNKWI